MLGRPGADFSFSGLKTALRHRLAEAAGGWRRADLAASFQAAVIDCLADRTAHGIAMAKALAPGDARWWWPAASPPTRGCARGWPRSRRRAACRSSPRRSNYCTDNAAMIAWAGIERLRLGLTDGLDFAPRPRWPLDPTAKPGARA